MPPLAPFVRPSTRLWDSPCFNSTLGFLAMAFQVAKRFIPPRVRFVANAICLSLAER
jgi:hypothetical protein